MSASRRFFLKAASTAVVGALLPIPAVAKIVSAPVPTKYEVTVSMVNSIVAANANTEEATRRFGVLLTYLLENFEKPQSHHIDEASGKLWNKFTLDDVSTLQNTMSDGVYPVAIAKLIVRNTSAMTPEEWSDFCPVYKDIILQSVRNMHTSNT